MAADALAQVAAQAEPVDRVIFDEPAELEYSLDVAQAAQFGMILAITGRNEFRRGTDPKITKIDQRNACTVARAAKPAHRTGAADGEDRDRDEHPVLRSLEIRTILAANADRRHPASRKRRQRRQIERRRRKRERGLGCRRPRGRDDDTKCGERGGQQILLRTARSAGRGFVEILHCRPLTPDAPAGRLVWLGAHPLLRQRCPKIAGRIAAPHRHLRWTRTLRVASTLPEHCLTRAGSLNFAHRYLAGMSSCLAFAKLAPLKGPSCEPKRANSARERHGPGSITAAEQRTINVRSLVIEDEPQIGRYISQLLGQLHGIVDVVGS